jgi:hypothetical protein
MEAQHTKIELPTSVRDAMWEVIDYLWRDELRHFGRGR